LHGSKRIRATRCGIQMVFQDPYNSFNPRLPIGFQMAEPLLVAGVKEVDQRRNRVCSMLEKIGLSEEVLDRYPGELSGGQLQRIAIGTALITHPDLLVADEPVSALDVSVQAQILDLFQELRKLLNFTCLFISHDLDVVYYLCDRVAVMDRGELVEQGRVEEIYQNPRHERTKALTRHLDFSDLFDASAE
jgi:ABC-type glutathione transport system ATPase component